MHDMRSKKDPTLVEYLLNKGKSEEDIAVYLGVEVSELETHSMDEGNGGIDGGRDEVGEVNTEDNLLFAEGKYEYLTHTSIHAHYRLLNAASTREWSNMSEYDGYVYYVTSRNDLRFVIGMYGMVKCIRWLIISFYT